MNYPVRLLLAAAWVGVMAPAAFAQVSNDPNSPDYAPAPVVEKEKPAPVAAPAPAPAKAAEPEAREIPSIDSNNEARSQPDVTFVTGGIGDDDKAAIEAAKADYNLYVMSASMNGAFVGDSRVTITRKNGKETEEMLSVISGPLLYVHLPAGSYTLSATLGEQVRKQNFVIAKGKPAHVHLSWKVSATLAR